MRPFFIVIFATLAVLSLIWIAQARYRQRRARRVMRGLSGAVARHPHRTALSIGAAVLLIRVALLPFLGKPIPSIPDEFSYLTMGQTFAAGRIANPPHPLWTHFETLFVLHQPVYASMYPPAQGLVLAAGQLVAGHPWWGVWWSVGCLCVALAWMLRQCLPPLWAAAGAVWAALQVGLSTYWIDSYWGGAMSAMGGALVLGAAARFRRGITAGNSLGMAAGLVLLAASRPYEGGIFGGCILAGVLWHLLRSKPRRGRGPMRALLPGCLLLLAGGAAIGAYNWRITGSPVTPPQYLYMRQYAFTKAFVWQKPPAPPEVRHAMLRQQLQSFESDQLRFDSVLGALSFTFWKIARIAAFYLGPLMLVPLLTLPWLLRTRLRGPILAAGATLTGVLLTIALYPHYAAPLTGFFYLAGMQSLRILWAAGRRGNPVGRFLVPAAPFVCLTTICLVATGPLARPAHLARADISAGLRRDGGRHVVIVRYGQFHNLADEWVYNDADIDRSPIVWARDMGLQNQELVQYYGGRKVWLLAADESPIRLVPLMSYGTTTRQ